jgi:hypothetical protein
VRFEAVLERFRSVPPVSVEAILLANFWELGEAISVTVREHLRLEILPPDALPRDLRGSPVLAPGDSTGGGAAPPLPHLAAQERVVNHLTRQQHPLH